ncbi:MAG TPA: RnfABCDGE type electron transport complex subunit D [Oscillospiraceae bacterium]|nr:RnfABCDGE type electron transport complex subunit D [Oscillospiraceae bacterium]
MLKKRQAPFIKREDSVATMMRDMIVALAFLMILPVIYNGFRVITMTLITVIACGVGEIIFGLICTREINVTELSSVVTGMIIAMLMPVNAPMWLPVVAAMFSVIVAKAPFGSVGNSPFNPAAAGVAFVTICWPTRVFGYYDSTQQAALPLFSDCSVNVVSSSASVLKSGIKPNVVPLQMLWEQIPGPIGATAAVVIAACGLYIFLKRTADWKITICFLATTAIYAALFPRILCSPLTSIKYEMLSGTLLFCSVFMITEPSTAPRTGIGRCVYGALAGILLMLFRSYGAYEQGACFAVLLMNAFSPCIDHAICSLKAKEVRRHEKVAEPEHTV